MKTQFSSEEKAVYFNAFFDDGKIRIHKSDYSYFSIHCKFARKAHLGSSLYRYEQESFGYYVHGGYKKGITKRGYFDPDVVFSGLNQRKKRIKQRRFGSNTHMIYLNEKIVDRAIFYVSYISKRADDILKVKNFIDRIDCLWRMRIIKKTSKSGREYHRENYSPQVWRNEMIDFVFEGYTQMDLSSSQYSIIASVAEDQGVKIPNIRKYVLNKNKIRNQMSNEAKRLLSNKKINLDDRIIKKLVKRSTNAVLFGGRKNIFKPAERKKWKETKTFKEFSKDLSNQRKKDIEIIFDIIMSLSFLKLLRKDIKKVQDIVEKRLTRKTGKGWRRTLCETSFRETKKDVICCNALQGAEKKLILDVIKKFNIKNYIDKHDGIIILDSVSLDGVNEYIKNQYKYCLVDISLIPSSVFIRDNKSVDLFHPSNSNVCSDEKFPPSRQISAPNRGFKSEGLSLKRDDSKPEGALNMDEFLLELKEKFDKIEDKMENINKFYQLGDLDTLWSRHSFHLRGKEYIFDFKIEDFFKDLLKIINRNRKKNETRENKSKT